MRVTCFFSSLCSCTPIKTIKIWLTFPASEKLARFLPALASRTLSWLFLLQLFWNRRIHTWPTLLLERRILAFDFHIDLAHQQPSRPCHRQMISLTLCWTSMFSWIISRLEHLNTRFYFFWSLSKGLVSLFSLLLHYTPTQTNNLVDHLLHMKACRQAWFSLFTDLASTPTKLTAACPMYSLSLGHFAASRHFQGSGQRSGFSPSFLFRFIAAKVTLFFLRYFFSARVRFLQRVVDPPLKFKFSFLVDDAEACCWTVSAVQLRFSNSLVVASGFCLLERFWK